MAPAFDDASTVQDEDLVGISNRRDAMRHDDRCALAHHAAQPSQNLFFRIRVDGGQRIVHGHSIIGDLFRERLDSYTEPRLYCEGMALDIDGGIYEGGPCLVARLAE